MTSLFVVQTIFPIASTVSFHSFLPIQIVFTTRLDTVVGLTEGRSCHLHLQTFASSSVCTASTFLTSSDRLTPSAGRFFTGISDNREALSPNARTDTRILSLVITVRLPYKACRRNGQRSKRGAFELQITVKNGDMWTCGGGKSIGRNLLFLFLFFSFLFFFL